MSEPFIAEIRMFACNYAPRDWAFCDGQLLPISQNPSLYSIIGTLYGGDGRSTMALPNLNNRAPAHQGRGPGLSDRRIGEFSGTEQVAITETQIPAHDHMVRAVAEGGSSQSPSDQLYMGQDKSSRSENVSYMSTETTSNATLANETIGNAGQNQPHENRQPFLGVNFCIALQGVYPPRS